MCQLFLSIIYILGLLEQFGKKIVDEDVKYFKICEFCQFSLHDFLGPKCANILILYATDVTFNIAV